jgi:hypothetical protein
VDNNCWAATVDPVSGAGLTTTPCGFLEFIPGESPTLGFSAHHPNGLATFSLRRPARCHRPGPARERMACEAACKELAPRPGSGCRDRHVATAATCPGRAIEREPGDRQPARRSLATAPCEGRCVLCAARLLQPVLPRPALALGVAPRPGARTLPLRQEVRQAFLRTGDAAADATLG